MHTTIGSRFLPAVLAALVIGAGAPAQAADYDLDIEGMHAFVEFKVPHLTYSVLSGRFNEFGGSFSWDRENPGESSVSVTIQTASLDSNHEERNQHLISEEFLNVAKHPTATFVSTSYDGDASGGTLSGNLTLNGVTRAIELAVSAIGEGKDPWGGYRAGFTATTTLRGPAFGYSHPFFPKEIEMAFGVEGVRRD